VKGLENWEYQDLQTAHKCLESLKDYKQKVHNLKNKLKELQEENERGFDWRQQYSLTTSTMRNFEEK
jgi:predicted nuclease with TOPRIM domain